MSLAASSTLTSVLMSDCWLVDCYVPGTLLPADVHSDWSRTTELTAGSSSNERRPTVKLWLDPGLGCELWSW